MTLSDGFCYGRLEATDLPPLVRAQEAGQLYLDRLRGRSCYDDVAQVAEWFLRQETGAHISADYRLLDARPGHEDRWHVRFVAPSTGETHLVTLTKTLSEQPRPVSCRTASQA